MGRDNAPDGFIDVASIEEIPEFASEAEEAEFWATHSFGDAMFERAEPITDEELPLDIQRTEPITLRIGEGTMRRIEALARARGVPTERLLRLFIDEGLERDAPREAGAGAGAAIAPR